MESDLFFITAELCGTDLGPFTTDNNPITHGRCWRQGWEEVKTPSFLPGRDSERGGKGERKEWVQTHCLLIGNS